MDAGDRQSSPDDLSHDVLLAKSLRAQGVDSSLFAEYGLELRDFGIGTLMKQWHGKVLFFNVREKTGVVLPSPPRDWSVDDVRLVVCLSVCRTVRPFLENAIMHEGWRSDAGARISTYFIGKCYFSFVKDYRDSLRQFSPGPSETVSLEALDLELDVVSYVHHRTAEDPARISVQRDEIRRLLKRATHAKIPAILFLLSRGMTHAEIGERLDMSKKAVDGAVQRFREDVREAHRWSR